MSHLDNALNYLGRVIDDLDHDWAYGQNLATKETLIAAKNADREFLMFVKTELAELRAENERLKAEREWLPIESAPKEAGFYLTLDRDECHNVSEFAHNAAGVLKWWTDEDEIFYPTHWQPLPPPPTEGTKL